MNEEQLDFFEKLVLVEREATKLAEDLPPGALRTRAGHIATAVKLLKARLDVFASIILASDKKKP